MAARLTLSVLVLVMAGISLCQAMRATAPKKCCFQFTKPVSERKVERYTFTHQSCPNAAVLLKMRNGSVCANLSERWVKDLIHKLDSKSLFRKVVFTE